MQNRKGRSQSGREKEALLAHDRPRGRPDETGKRNFLPRLLRRTFPSFEKYRRNKSFQVLTKRRGSGRGSKYIWRQGCWERNQTFELTCWMLCNFEAL
jgi:hypothetical protein